jgi:hypothetical protein
VRGVWRWVYAIEGSDTCIKIGGAIGVGAGVSSGSR